MKSPDVGDTGTSPRDGSFFGRRVHSAGVAERAGAKRVFETASDLPQCQNLQKLWADNGYNGRPLA